MPVQLSPQRLQSIGITSAPVEIKPLSNEVRAVGNVAVDERLQAYVQTRFSGWIQKVFVDTTYQFVRKGQPLFTIYSPDVVTTEQEYLLAKQNRKLLSQSTVPGVAQGAHSLLTAAEERLRQWDIPQREIQHLQATGQVRHGREAICLGRRLVGTKADDAGKATGVAAGVAPRRLDHVEGDLHHHARFHGPVAAEALQGVPFEPAGHLRRLGVGGAAIGLGEGGQRPRRAGPIIAAGMRWAGVANTASSRPGCWRWLRNSACTKPRV